MGVAVLTIACVAAVAWANGGNDVSKGVATLVGSRLATYAQALRWGTLWTVAGAVTALALSSAMLRTCSTGLVGGSVGTSDAFPFAVAAGAFLWVLIASRTALPASTTHALAGAIVGAALAAGGPDGVRWGVLFNAVALPLAFSPLAAGLVAYGLHAFAGRRVAAASRFCVCARERPVLIADPSEHGAAAARSITLPVIIVDDTNRLTVHT